MKKYCIALIAVAILVCAWLLMRNDAPQPQSDGAAAAKTATKRQSRRYLGKPGEMSKARKRIESASGAIKGRADKSARKVRIVPNRDAESDWTDEDGNPWPEKQKAVMRAVLAASESDDFDALEALAGEVAKTENAEIREQYVNELGWFGERSFTALLGFLSDPSDDVVEAARTQMTDAFQEIDADADKASIFTALSKAVTDSELMDGLGDELVCMDEVMALQTIADVIAGGTKCARKKAMEVYETITDEKWTGLDSAETWLQQNYDRPDEDDGEDE